MSPSFGSRRNPGHRGRVFDSEPSTSTSGNARRNGSRRRWQCGAGRASIFATTGSRRSCYRLFVFDGLRPIIQIAVLQIRPAPSTSQIGCSTRGCSEKRDCCRIALGHCGDLFCLGHRWRIQMSRSPAVMRKGRNTKSTVEPVVPITSARPPRPTPPLEPHSAANSQASIPHRAEDAVGRRAKRDNGNRDRGS